MLQKYTIIYIKWHLTSFIRYLLLEVQYNYKNIIMHHTMILKCPYYPYSLIITSHL
uniref:Uncharacterized protein n=1 Tax=Rhizophora mucronata TaxID=61149 RepID=A0A2P2NJ60_RHIMU